MENADLSKYGFLGVLLVLLYFSYHVIRPFLTPLLFSIILVITAWPAYQWLTKKTKRPRLSSLLLVIGLLLILVIPSFFIGYTLVREAPAAYETFVDTVNLTSVDEFAQETIGQDIGLEQSLERSSSQFRDYVFSNAGALLSGASSVLLGMFIMFFVMYFLFTDGLHLLDRIKNLIPLDKHHQNKLYTEIGKVVHGIVNGQLIIGAIQGLVGGVLLAILGINTPVFWGFVMAVTSMIPFLGAASVWVPMSLWLLLTGDVVGGVTLGIVGAAIISQIDNVLRPLIYSRTARIHPAVVLVGVFGGLAAFGLVGFITGPLVLALFGTVMRRTPSLKLALTWSSFTFLGRRKAR